MQRKNEVTSQIKLNKLKNYNVFGFGDGFTYLDHIISLYNEKTKGKPYVKAHNNVQEELNMAFYYSQYNSNADYLPKFLLPISSDMEKYLNKKKWNFSYVLFVWNDKGIFAITGGQGYNVISNYIDRDFGYKFLTFMGFSEFKVKGSSEKSIVGHVFSESRFFREGYDFNFEDRFGKSLDSINVTANVDYITKIFDLSFSNKRKLVSCDVKNGLTIRKKANIIEIINIIRKLLEINLSENQFASLKIINQSTKNKALLDKLENDLWHNLFTWINSDNTQTETTFAFDIMNEDIERFFTASNYSIYHNGQETECSVDDTCNLKMLLKDTYEKYVSEKSYDSFRLFFSNSQLVSHDVDRTEITNDYVINHIYCESQYNNKVYFRIDRQWSIVEDEFKIKLEKDFSSLLPEYTISLPFTTVFKGESEVDIINRISKESDVIKAHQTYPDGRHEFCDLIYWSLDMVYIIHVKVGTGVEIRELTQQIDLSAQRYKRCKASGNREYFYSVYNTLSKNNRTNLSQDDFINILNNKNPCFVGLICIDLPNINNPINDIDSCIARYSILDLIYKQNDIGHPVKFGFLYRCD